MKEIETICPYCGTGCSLVLQVEDDRITGGLPSKTSPVNNGKLCSKGHFGMDFVHSKERLQTPLMRIDGRLEQVSWEDAYDTIVDRFQSYKEKYGPNSIAGFSSARCTNEENYLLQKLMRAGIGTNNVDHCARL